MTVVPLSGCRSTPLLSYLQGLGLLRVLHHQYLRGVVSFWRGSTLHLEGTANGEMLVDFLLRRYRPTPILSPWNGGGGFRIRKAQKGERAVQKIRDTSDPRFAGLRNTIDQAREVVLLAKEEGWVDSGGKATAQTKPLLMAACRSSFPDEALDWLDAAFVLSDDKKPNYPLLLGTGGNLGRGDLSINYLEALDELLDPDKLARSRHLLEHALFGQGNPGLDEGLVGQFSPGGAGTVNSSAFGSATSTVNPWSFVLALEGTLLFASGIARRFKGGRGLATIPFTVAKSPVGFSASDDEALKGEMWLPMWDRRMTLPEVRRILAEGRLSWDGRHASNGVDAAKAISTLGVDRGLSRFERYVVATRYGNMTLAVPVGSYLVAQQPAKRVHLIRNLDPWVNRIQRSRLPTAARTAIRRVDAAQMEVVRTPKDPRRLQDLLAEVALLEWVVGRNPDLRSRARSPLPSLPTNRWANLLDDGTVEWRLALSIATQRDRFQNGHHLSNSEQRRGAAACFLRPVKLHTVSHGRYLLDWTDRMSDAANLASVSVDDAVANILIQRAILCGNRSTSRDVTTIGSGTPIAFDRFSPVPMTYIAAFLEGHLDGRRLDRKRLARLITAAAMLDRPPSWDKFTAHRDDPLEGITISPARALLGPFFHPRALTRESNAGEETKVLLLPSPSWPQKLRADNSRSVLSEALIRIRAAGYQPGVRPESLRVMSSQRLAASLLIPAFPYEVKNAIEIVCPNKPDLTTEGAT